MPLSSSLVWALIRDNNSFLVKGKNGIHFSRENGNLRNLHSPRYSGLANRRTAHVGLNKEGKAVITLTKSKGRDTRRPAKRTRTVPLTKHFRKIAKTIKGELNLYRPDLIKSALARYTKISKSLKYIQEKQKKKDDKKVSAAVVAKK